MNWKQLQTIFWLRWRLMCNQWRRTGGLGAVFTAAIMVFALGLGFVMFVAGAAAAYGLRQQTPTVIMVVWLGLTLGFLLFWLVGLLTELQRSETIDLQKLMHLPVGLGQMFTINYLASHFVFSLLMMVPAMMGLALGLTIFRAPQMILLIPLAISMVLMITAWTYCLRGWLATLMSNPRRRRAVIMGISMVFILLAQGPNLYFNVFQRHHNHHNSTASQSTDQGDDSGRRIKENFTVLVGLQRYVPPLWVPLGARNLAEGNPVPALLGTLGCAGLAGLGLRRAYRSTVRFYHGETGGKAGTRKAAAATPKSAAASRKSGRKSFLEYTIPFVPEQSAALALATFRSLLRAPEVKMAWGSSFIVTLVAGSAFLFRGTGNVEEVWKPFLATAAAVFPTLFLAQFFGNQFGFDRDGFRALMLSPADRRLILLGKNLATLPVGGFMGLLLVALTTIRFHLGPFTVLATVCQIGGVLLMAAIVGNLLSLLAPYRIQPGSMKPTKMPGLAMILLMMSQMLFPLALMPVFAGPALQLLWSHFGWPKFMPVNLLASVVLFGLMLVAYWQLLTPMGRLLQRREPKILAVIAVEVE